MSSLLDLITATIIFSMLILTVARVQTNINVSMFENQHSVVTQTNAVELARQIEWDFAKIGYRALGQKIVAADSMHIRFLADLENVSMVQDVAYTAGDTSQLPFTANANDFPLFRRVGSHTVKQNFGLTHFRITYFDSAYQRIPTPITLPAELSRIRAIHVAFRTESPDPVISLSDTTWKAVTWEKMILPRNLGNLNY